MRAPAAWLLAGILVPLALGCSDVQGPSTTAWEGTLVPVDKATRFGGRVAAVSEASRTRASITIQKAEPSATHSWRLRAGSCDSPGELVGGVASYPELFVGASGTASAEAVLSETLRADGDYHAVVLEETDSGAVIACGALERVTFAG